MQSLINVENRAGKLVVSSREVAKNFDKRHADVTKAIEDLINKEGCAKKLVDLCNMFIYSEYQNEQNKQWYTEYLLTRDGFSLLVMGFTGTKALEWKIKYIKAFNAMEKALQEVPLSIEDMMIRQLEEQKKIKAEITATKEDVSILKHKVDNQITLDHGQQRVIQREVAKRVYERVEQWIKDYKDWSCLIDIKHTKEFSPIIKRYYASIYKEIKNRFGVPSYRDIRVKDFELAINYIRNWVEPKELREAC